MIKKEIICIVFISILKSTLYAQDQLDFAINKTVIPKEVYFKTSSFQIEDQCILEIEEAIPHSVVEFYSTPHGGDLIKRTLLDSKGGLQISFDIEKSPSFVLNPVHTVLNSAKGSGFVQYLDQKDFIVQNISMVKEDNTLSINFESLTNPDKTVVYELVVLNVKGIQNTIHTFNPNTNKDWENFSFNHILEPRTQYRFVVKSRGKERYVKELYNSEEQNNFVVYPSIAENEISIELKQALEKSLYTITNVNGVILLKGELTDLKTKVQIGHLAQGTYFIRLDKYPQDGIQFIKQ